MARCASSITRSYAEGRGIPVVPCGCSQKTGTVRRSLRDMVGELEKEHPRLKESLLSAMGNIQTDRLLDTRYLPDDGPVETPEETNPLVVVR